MLDKTTFKPDTRYTLALRDAAGKARPAKLYVYRTDEKFMVARATSGDGLLRKLAYESIERIVDETPVAGTERFFLPATLLEEKSWKDKDVMQVYASAPGRGK